METGNWPGSVALSQAVHGLVSQPGHLPVTDAPMAQRAAKSAARRTPPGYGQPDCRAKSNQNMLVHLLE